MRKSLVTATTALAISALAGICGSDAASPGTQAGAKNGSSSTVNDLRAGHNEQDIAFAGQMIPHLSQVRDMAKAVLARSSNPAVLDLAARIVRAQDPDIQKLVAWLYMWGEENLPSTDNEAVRKLQQAENAQLDRMWTQMTIERHERAIALAKTELDKGQHPAARQFAQKIADTRQAEISEMREWAQS